MTVCGLAYSVTMADGHNARSISWHAKCPVPEGQDECGGSRVSPNMGNRPPAKGMGPIGSEIHANQGKPKGLPETAGAPLGHWAYGGTGQM